LAKSFAFKGAHTKHCVFTACYYYWLNTNKPLRKMTLLTFANKEKSELQTMQKKKLCALISMSAECDKLMIFNSAI
jgi:hypothetical protein